MHAGRLDEVDVKLLTLLQDNGRIKRSELAKEVNMSIPSVSERLRRLEEEGFIMGYCTRVSPRKLGLSLLAFVTLEMDSSTYYKQVIEHAIGEEQILECHGITGTGSHILKVRTEDTEGLGELLSKIRAWPGVKSTRTSVVLNSPKESMAIPLSHYDSSPQRSKR